MVADHLPCHFRPLLKVFLFFSAFAALKEGMKWKIPDALLSSLMCVPALFFPSSWLSVFIYNPCIYSSHKHPLICGRRLSEDGNRRTQTTSQRSLPLLTGSVYHCLPNLQADAAWPPGPNPRVWTWQCCLY